ncbi:MAG: SurA N-terminal domain-containing protein [Candidatus Omnitrophota bacterium]
MRNIGDYMLNPLRKKAVIKFTMWALIATFVLWGVGSATMTTRNYAGIIYGRKVYPQEYQSAYSAVLTRAKIRYGDKLPQVSKYIDLGEQAWDRLLLLQYAKRRRLNASNRDVIERIAQMQLFQRGGYFDKSGYDYIVENIFGISERQFEESVREDIIISKLVEAMQNEVTVSDEEILEGYRIKNEKADISYILINADSFKNEVVIDDKELEPFYNANTEQFRSPEKINAYYVKAPFAAGEAESSAGDKAKKEAERLAHEINDYLNTGEDFSALAQKYNLELKETGPFALSEEIPEIGLSYPFSITTASLGDEKTNDVVEEKDAFYVIKLKEKTPSSIRSFQEAQADVRLALIADKADKLALASAQNYADILKSGKDTLENISQQLGVELNKRQDIARQSSVDGVGNNPEFNSACFSINEQGSVGPVKVENGYAIIRLDKLKPPDQAAFEKEKQEFSKELLDKKRGKFFEDWFVDFKKHANLKKNI